MNVIVIAGLVVAVVLMILGLLISLRSSSSRKNEIDNFTGSIHTPVSADKVDYQEGLRLPDFEHKTSSAHVSAPDDIAEVKIAKTQPTAVQGYQFANLSPDVQAAMSAVQEVHEDDGHTAFNITDNQTENQLSESANLANQANQALTTEQAAVTMDTVKTATIEPWTGSSPLIDEHHAECIQQEQDFSLSNATHVVVVYLLPTNYRAIEGDKVVEAFKRYGLLFGELSLFHRYEESNGSGALMFSALRYTPEGAQGFDLDNINTDKFQGLAFFLALPHADGLKGFDMMNSLAGLLARDFNANLYDEEMNTWTRERVGVYRQKVVQMIK